MKKYLIKAAICEETEQDIKVRMCMGMVMAKDKKEAYERALAKTNSFLDKDGIYEIILLVTE